MAAGSEAVAEERAPKTKDPLTHRIIGAAIEVHRELGPGLLESAYEQCLAYELSQCDLDVERQVELPLEYKGMRLEGGYRIDLLIEQRVIVELKTVEAILPVHEAQLLSYMRLADKQVGLLMNFHTNKLRDGIKRFVL